MDTDDIPVLDNDMLAQVAEFLPGEKFGAFIATSLQGIEQGIESFRISTDPVEWRAQAHGLVSLAGNLGLKRLVFVSRALMQAIDRNDRMVNSFLNDAQTEGAIAIRLLKSRQ